MLWRVEWKLGMMHRNRGRSPDEVCFDSNPASPREFRALPSRFLQLDIYPSKFQYLHTYSLKKLC